MKQNIININFVDKNNADVDQRTVLSPFQENI